MKIHRINILITIITIIINSTVSTLTNAHYFNKNNIIPDEHQTSSLVNGKTYFADEAKKEFYHFTTDSNYIRQYEDPYSGEFIKEEGKYTIKDDKIKLDDGNEMIIKDHFILYTKDADGYDFPYQVYFREEDLTKETDLVKDAIYNDYLKKMENEHPKLEKIKSVDMTIYRYYFYGDSRDDGAKNITASASFEIDIGKQIYPDTSECGDYIYYLGEGGECREDYLLGGGFYSLDRTTTPYRITGRSNAP